MRAALAGPRGKEIEMKQTRCIASGTYLCSKTTAAGTAKKHFSLPWPQIVLTIWL